MTLILSHNCPLSIWQAERIFDHPGWTRFDSVVYPLHLHSRSAALHQATTWPRNSRKRMIAPKPGPASLILALKRTEQRVLWLSVWCVLCFRFGRSCVFLREIGLLLGNVSACLGFPPRYPFCQD